MDLLTKEEKDALLAKRMEEIRKKNKEREERHKEIVADKKHAEEQKAAVSSGASEYIRHNRDAHSPAGADESQVSNEIARRENNWEATKYREEWPERQEDDEPQYWQQTRQRGSRDSAAAGQWTRGGGGRHIVSSWQSQPSERSADGRGRRGGRGGHQSFRPDDSQYADADDCSLASSASHASSNLVSPTTTKGEPTDHRRDAQTSSGKIAAKGDSELASTTASATASHASNADMPAGRGTGRGRGRGIVPTSDQAKQEQLLREAERPAAPPGGLQSLARQQQPQPSSEPPRSSPPVEQISTPSKPSQHPQATSKRNENYQIHDSADAVAGRQQLADQLQKQPSERDGHQGQRAHYQQQSYEETRKRNAAAYEESLRKNPGSAGGGFLADRHRDVQTDYSKTNEEIRQYRQQQLSSENQVESPVRHQRNFGGASADLEQVKNKVKEVAHVKQDAYRGRPPAEQSLELRMTGHERQQYAAWREEQRLADQARIERSRRPGDGGWRRQWDSEKSFPPSEESAAAQHGDRSAGPPRNAGTRRVGSGRTLAGARLDNRRSPDQGGDRATVQAKEPRSPTSEGREQPEAVFDSSAENAKRSGHGRQRRNRENRENQRAKKEPREPESAPRRNISAHGGAGDASTAVIGGTPQHVQKEAGRQSSSSERLAADDRQHALPTQHTAPTGKSDGSLKTCATAEDSCGATKQDNQPQQQASVGDAGGGAAADAPSAHESDEEWEDVDDDVEEDDDEEYDPEEGGDGGSSGRRVVDWAAEVENEYGSS